jgi:hypothetical protein
MADRKGHLLEDTKITIEAPTIAGTSTIDSAAYNMAGFDGIVFVVRLGTPAANNNIRVQQDIVTGMGAAADLTGTLVNSATLNQHMVDVKRPIEQFVRCRVTRGTSTTIDSIVAIQYRARQHPVTQPATSVSEQWHSPIEGTA